MAALEHRARRPRREVGVIADFEEDDVLVVLDQPEKFARIGLTEMQMHEAIRYEQSISIEIDAFPII